MSRIDGSSPLEEDLRCPVCRARFRNAPACSRCGTDLSLLMHAAAQGWVAKQRARAALLAGNLGAALRFHDRAEQIRRR